MTNKNRFLKIVKVTHKKARKIRTEKQNKWWV